MAGLILPLSGCGNGSRSSSTHAATESAPATTEHTTPPPTTTSIPSSNGSATAVLPAQFTVNADESLSPPQVGGPAHTTILVTITSRASHSVQIAVASHSFAVPAGGRGSLRLTGLKNGSYPIDVSGRPRGTLVVGVQPGP